MLRLTDRQIGETQGINSMDEIVIVSDQDVRPCSACARCTVNATVVRSDVGWHYAPLKQMRERETPVRSIDPEGLDPRSQDHE